MREENYLLILKYILFAAYLLKYLQDEDMMVFFISMLVFNCIPKELKLKKKKIKPKIMRPFSSTMYFINTNKMNRRK